MKVDNIEGYSLKTLSKLQEVYENFLENSEGTDPDFPMHTFGDHMKKVKGVNAARFDEND